MHFSLFCHTYRHILAIGTANVSKATMASTSANKKHTSACSDMIYSKSYLAYNMYYVNYMQK